MNLWNERNIGMDVRCPSSQNSIILVIELSILYTQLSLENEAKFHRRSCEILQNSLAYNLSSYSTEK